MKRPVVLKRDAWVYKLSEFSENEHLGEANKTCLIGRQLGLFVKTNYTFPITFSRCVVSFAGILILALCFKAQTLPAAAAKDLQNYSLVFSDDFKMLDLAAYTEPVASKAHTWYEGVWFNHEHAPLDCFRVANSELSMTWKRGQREPDSSISTFFRNDRAYRAWRYGYFEARMKWKPITGSWPAFWLTSVPPSVEEAPSDSSEIDIFEGQGDEPHSFFGTIHRWSGPRQLASTSDRNRFSLPADTDFGAYHTYGLLWVPGRVTWYFDDRPLHSERTYAAFDKQEFLLTLGMQEGANWTAGDLSGVTAQSLTLGVDWVRVWQARSTRVARKDPI